MGMLSVSCLLLKLSIPSEELRMMAPSETIWRNVVSGMPQNTLA